MHPMQLPLLHFLLSPRQCSRKHTDSSRTLEKRKTVLEEKHYIVDSVDKGWDRDVSSVNAIYKRWIDTAEYDKAIESEEGVKCQIPSEGKYVVVL